MREDLDQANEGANQGVEKVTLPLHLRGPWSVEENQHESWMIFNHAGDYVIADVDIAAPRCVAEMMAAAPRMREALEIIAALPMAEQDDLLSANMRRIARAALSDGRLTADSSAQGARASLEPNTSIACEREG